MRFSVRNLNGSIQSSLSTSPVACCFRSVRFRLQPTFAIFGPPRPRPELNALGSPRMRVSDLGRDTGCPKRAAPAGGLIVKTGSSTIEVLVMGWRHFRAPGNFRIRWRRGSISMSHQEFLGHFRFTRLTAVDTLRRSMDTSTSIRTATFGFRWSLESQSQGTGLNPDSSSPRLDPLKPHYREELAVSRMRYSKALSWIQDLSEVAGL